MTTPEPIPPQPAEFRGRCPICSGSLVEDESDLTFVLCSHSPKHYRIKKDLFNSAWETFEKGYKNGNISLEASASLTYALMSALMTSNVGVDAPPLDPSTWTI